MLQIIDLSSSYGRIQALRQVSLQVEEGEIVAIIGPNGAGKTTLLNTVCGLVRACGGEIRFQGQDITNMPTHRIVRLGVSQVPERRQVFDTLSVRENLLLGAYQRFRHERRSTIEADLQQVCELFPLLQDRLDEPAETLSGGMQQMLAIGRGLMARPKLLLLDEPSLGLAPLLVREIFRIILELRRQGTTVLLVEQNARAALRVADRGYVLETGHVTMSGTAAELARDEAIQRAYLGRSVSGNHGTRVGASEGGKEAGRR